jgi:hypothetical protein
LDLLFPTLRRAAPTLAAFLEVKMGFIRQLMNAFGGAKPRAVVDRFADRQKAGAVPPTPPGGIPPDRSKPAKIFGKLGTVPSRHKPVV